MAKYKIELIVTEQTFLALLDKLSPGDSLKVEKITEQSPAVVPHVTKIDQLLARAYTKQKRRRYRRGIDLKHGINKIIMDVLADGMPHHAVDFEGPVVEAGYKRDSVGSRVYELTKHGAIKKSGLGVYVRTWEDKSETGTR